MLLNPLVCAHSDPLLILNLNSKTTLSRVLLNLIGTMKNFEFWK